MVLETYTGLAFDYDDPQPEMISLIDIARALSMTARFGGHTTRFYSVAAHALLVRALVVEAGHPELALAALHHDSHEAYLGDIPTPLKRSLGRKHISLAADIDATIGDALDIDPDLFHHPIVRQADTDALFLEAERLKRSRAQGPHWSDLRRRVPVVPSFPPFWKWGSYRTPAVAEQAFLRAHTASKANVVAA